jgi:hypothetical protein
MPKGFFTQGVCVLLERPATLDDIARLLRDFQVVKRIDRADNPDMGGPSLVIPFRPDVNGYVSVDLQDRPWPDQMGDPKGAPRLFAAWSMGHFGPFAFPGNLQRAAEQSWGWQEAAALPGQHRAFIRVRSSYVFGGDGDAPVLPEDYQPRAELEFVTRLARALLNHPAALAYFNPNGEVLLDAGRLDRSVDYHTRHGLPPLNAWTNVRLFNASDGWILMDTVGMAQLDCRDSEACFPRDAYEPQDVDEFLRNCSLYLLDRGDVIKHGDTMNGPGGINWRASHVEDGVCAPPRRLLRWFPVDGSRPPSELE